MKKAKPSLASPCFGGRGRGPVTIDLASARRPLADYAADLGDEILVLTEGDRAVAASARLRNVDRESLALSQHPEFLRIIARSRAELAAGRKLTLQQMRRAVSPERPSRKRTRRFRRS